MSKGRKQLYQLTEHQVARLTGQGTYPGAQVAWQRAREIREARGRPPIFYSEFNGFTVLNDNDTNVEVSTRIISLQQRSRPFPA